MLMPLLRIRVFTHHSPAAQVALATYLAKWNPRDAPKPSDRCVTSAMYNSGLRVEECTSKSNVIDFMAPHGLYGVELGCICPAGILARSGTGLTWSL